MNNNFLFVSIPWLAIAVVIEGYFEKSLRNFFARNFLALKKRKQRIDKAEMQYILELAGDVNFLILESIRVFAQGATFFSMLIMYFIVSSQSLSMDLVALFFGIISIWMGHKATTNLNLINQARELYLEDKKINDEFGPDFDETAYLSKSPKNVEVLRRAIKQHEIKQYVDLEK